MKIALFGLVLASLLVLSPITTFATTDDDYVGSIKTFLHDNFDAKDAGMVVALVDANGTTILSAGAMGDGFARPVDGDTLFEIGSTTKTFVAVLLLDAAERGEVKLDDPVSKYLPETVKVPSRNGKPITLLNLAAQDSGLPFNPNNFSDAPTWAEKFNSYTADQMYAFLSSFTLTQDPGEKFQYSNIGMALLGHAMERNTGQKFEDLVIDRICRPLHMDSTCMKLSPELQQRFAKGHGEKGEPTGNYELTDFAGAGGLRSTASDLAKYIAANLDLAPSKLNPLMQKMQVIRHRGQSFDWGNTAMPWISLDLVHPDGSELLGHAGGTDGYSAFIGFDRTQRRGVVVLSNQKPIRPQNVGWRILQRARLLGVDPVRMMPVRSIVGLGIALDLDSKTQTLRITQIVPNSPAAHAKMQPGVTIESINGTPVAGKTLEQSLQLLRGAEGTPVRLKLADATTKPTQFELTRARFVMDQ